MHSLEDKITVLKLENLSLSERIEQSETSLQKISSSIAQRFIKTLVQIDSIKNGYSFIETNGGYMTIFCKEEPNKNNSFVGKFLIGNPNTFIVKELTVSMSFSKGDASEIETKKYSISKDIYPGSWAEISIRADELNDIRESKKSQSPIIEIFINRVDFKGDVEKMTKVIDLMKLSKSI